MSFINRNLIARIEEKFMDLFGNSPEFIVRAPGRVNLLGEHVDYNGGFVMPAAIDRATYLAFSPASSTTTLLAALDFDDTLKIDNSSVNSKTQVDGSPLPEWGLYPGGVMHTLLKKEVSVQPMNGVFASDIPRGSGLSSSAAVEMAFMTGWQNLGGKQISLMERALVCQEAEMSYVGVNCGIMDQFASACGIKNRLLYLDCRTLEWESIVLPENLAIVIADTTIRRKLTSGNYNIRRAECETALHLLKRKMPAIESLRDVNVTDYDNYSWLLPKEIEKRARHVIEEIERTRAGRTCLEMGDIDSFGKCMNASHNSLRDLYEVSCPELDVMVEIAQSLEGCLGARMTGAGFGGCTVNLVETQKKDAFTALLKEKFQKVTGISSKIYLTQASDGARILR